MELNKQRIKKCFKTNKDFLYYNISPLMNIIGFIFVLFIEICLFILNTKRIIKVAETPLWQSLAITNLLFIIYYIYLYPVLGFYRSIKAMSIMKLHNIIKKRYIVLHMFYIFTYTLDIIFIVFLPQLLSIKF